MKAVKDEHGRRWWRHRGNLIPEKFPCEIRFEIEQAELRSGAIEYDDDLREGCLQYGRQKIEPFETREVDPWEDS